MVSFLFSTLISLFVSVLFTSKSSLVVESSFSESITAITSPTFITSFTLNFFSTKIPDTSEGISESTLSVETSTIDSSISISSPTSLSHDVKVASLILSPIDGNFTKSLPIIFCEELFLGQIYKILISSMLNQCMVSFLKYSSQELLHQYIQVRHLPGYPWLLLKFLYQNLIIFYLYKKL